MEESVIWFVDIEHSISNEWNDLWLIYSYEGRLYQMIEPKIDAPVEICKSFSVRQDIDHSGIIDYY